MHSSVLLISNDHISLVDLRGLTFKVCAATFVAASLEQISVRGRQVNLSGTFLLHIPTDSFH